MNSGYHIYLYIYHQPFIPSCKSRLKDFSGLQILQIVIPYQRYRMTDLLEGDFNVNFLQRLLQRGKNMF